MEHKTLLSILLLGCLTTANSQYYLPLREVAEAETEPLEKQLAEISSLISSLVQPAFSNILAAFTTNLGSAVQNAFSATLAGKQLELITLDSMTSSAESPVHDAQQAAHPNTLGGVPPKRRPYTRSMTHDDKPLKHSEPKTSANENLP